MKKLLKYGVGSIICVLIGILLVFLLYLWRLYGVPPYDPSVVESLCNEIHKNPQKDWAPVFEYGKEHTLDGYFAIHYYAHVYKLSRDFPKRYEAHQTRFPVIFRNVNNFGKDSLIELNGEINDNHGAKTGAELKAEKKE